MNAKNFLNGLLQKHTQKPFFPQFVGKIAENVNSDASLNSMQQASLSRIIHPENLSSAESRGDLAAMTIATFINTCHY